MNALLKVIAWISLLLLILTGREFAQTGASILPSGSDQAYGITYHWETVRGVKIFYRQAGDPRHPALVLLHGFPSSSIMYQDLIRLLQHDFFLIAPDYPAHGYSETPSPEQYAYTFDNISVTIDSLLGRLQVQRYGLFMQDYGAPVGFRLAVRHPEKITSLIIQNGNAYMEGFPEAQDSMGELRTYWRDKNKKYEEDWMAYYRKANQLPPDQWGLESSVSPERRALNASVILQPGRLQLFMDLWYDYGNNVKSYPLWHAYLKKYQPPVLITWGKEDTYFTVPGALAYLQDVPKAEVHLLNGGHWAASETSTEEIALLIRSFFSRSGTDGHPIIPR